MAGLALFDGASRPLRQFTAQTCPPDGVLQSAFGALPATGPSSGGVSTGAAPAARVCAVGMAPRTQANLERCPQRPLCPAKSLCLSLCLCTAR
jgi:hypothetical protein